jgi:hypothetical protein
MRGVPGTSAGHAALWLLLLTCVIGEPASGQAASEIRGRVVDADDGRGLANTTVEVVGSARSVVTDAQGTFLIQNLPRISVVHLRAGRLGYGAETAAVSMQNGRNVGVVIRLSPVPIHLQAVEVERLGRPPLALSVSRRTLRQVPPAGEPDIFRALTLLPGVAQPNDLKGRLHMAGGASDETGVRLDGHPLHDPFHLFGILGAFNVGALDGADVLIHNLPVAYGDHLSGIIDLQTRQVSSRNTGEATVGLLASGVTWAGTIAPLNTDLLVSGRVAYLDRLLRLFESLTEANSDAPSIGFRDGLVRVGKSWDGGWRLEGIAFSTRDRFVESRLRELDGYVPLTWGESLHGVRLQHTGEHGGFWVRISRGFSHARLDERGGGVDTTGLARTNVLNLGRERWSGEILLERIMGPARLSVGGSLDSVRIEQHWVAEGLADEIFSPNTPSRFEGTQHHTVRAAFGEATVDLGRWAGGLGMRTGGLRHLAPRAWLAFRPHPRLDIELAANRRHQWEAELEEPIEGSITPPRFLLSEPRVADVVALSVQSKSVAHPDTGIRFTIQTQGFLKRYHDRLLLEGESSTLAGATPDSFPRFLRIPGRSAGLTIKGQAIFSGKALLSGTYTFQRAVERVDGEWFPTSWDAPHLLSLLGNVRLGRGWNLTGVYQGHSGRATTPVLARVFEPTLDSPHLHARYLRGRRNSIRVTPYHRADLGVNRTWEGNKLETTLRLQVLNMLLRKNAVDYDWQQYFRSLEARGKGEAGRYGIPFLPSVLLEVRW